MKKMHRKIFGTVATTLTFCLTLLFISSTSFAEQCVDNGDGTVTDYNNRLMWQKDLAGGVWARAIHTADISIGGHSDWRLPSREELMGLYHSVCKSMMLVKNDDYWSSSQYKNNYGAWVVNFRNGTTRQEVFTKYYYIRFVRNAR